MWRWLSSSSCPLPTKNSWQDLFKSLATDSWHWSCMYLEKILVCILERFLPNSWTFLPRILQKYVLVEEYVSCKNSYKSLQEYWRFMQGSWVLGKKHATYMQDHCHTHMQYYCHANARSLPCTCKTVAIHMQDHCHAHARSLPCTCKIITIHMQDHCHTHARSTQSWGVLFRVSILESR